MLDVVLLLAKQGLRFRGHRDGKEENLGNFLKHVELNTIYTCIIQLRESFKEITNALTAFDVLTPSALLLHRRENTKQVPDHINIEVYGQIIIESKQDGQKIKLRDG